MTYYQALRLKYYLMANYGSDKCGVLIHYLTQYERNDYESRGAKIHGLYGIRIHIHIDGCVAEYVTIDKKSLKSMRSLMLDCKKGLY